MMHMTFYWGNKVVLLFDSWRTDSWVGYSLTLLAVFLVATFYQFMEDRRIRFKAISLSKAYPPSSVEAPLLLSHFFVRRKSHARLIVSILFGINSAIGYLLMLSVMSFNAGVFIAAVVGLAVGYLLYRSSGEEDLITVENPCACS